MEVIIATTQEDQEKVFKLRYQVYVEEEQKFGGVELTEKKLKDEFDEHTGTVNLLMLENKEAVGTVRITKTCQKFGKLPCDKLYDFDSVRNENVGLIPCNLGMLALRNASRTPKTFTTLMLAVSKLLLTSKEDYYIFTLNHECSNLFRRVMGAKMLSEKLWSAEICNFIIPMILYKQQVLRFVERYEPQEALVCVAA